jgi:hypothetical protein
MKIVLGNQVISVATFSKQDNFFAAALAVAIANEQVKIEDLPNGQWLCHACNEDNLADIFSKTAEKERFGSYFDLKELANVETAEVDKYIFNMQDVTKWFNEKYNHATNGAANRQALSEAVRVEKRGKFNNFDNALFELVLIEALAGNQVHISSSSTKWRLMATDLDGNDLDVNFKNNLKEIRNWFDEKYNQDDDHLEERKKLLQRVASLKAQHEQTVHQPCIADHNIKDNKDDKIRRLSIVPFFFKK